MTKKYMNTKKIAQSIVEYGLIMAVMVAAAVTVLNKFGKNVSSVGTRSNNEVNSTSIQEYCNSIPNDQRVDCRNNIK